MYSAELRLSTGGDAARDVAIVRRPFGIRRLGVQGPSIYLDAKRFVVRGVRLDSPTAEDLNAARRAASALYIDEATDALLLEASEAGVLLVVRLGQKPPQNAVTAELDRIGRWPAVAIAVIDADVPAGKELRLAARNTLLAQACTTAAAAAELKPWADVLWCEIAQSVSPIDHSAARLPVIVYRPMLETETISHRRESCDRLQADLAPLGDFTGFFT
jgi:hypothetical protein